MHGTRTGATGISPSGGKTIGTPSIYLHPKLLELSLYIYLFIYLSNKTKCILLSCLAEYVDRLQDLLFDGVLEELQLFQDSLKGLQVPDHLCTQFQSPDKSEAVAQHTI